MAALIPGLTFAEEALPSWWTPENDLTLFAEADLSELLLLSSRIAEHAFAIRAELDPCLEAAFDDPTCHEPFIQRFVGRAFRRPLGPEELAEYQELFALTAAEFDAETAFKQVVRAALMSPSFLFLTEFLGREGLGNQRIYRLTQYEIAAHLSYALTDGPPDDALVQAANNGELGDRHSVSGQALRLLLRSEATLPVWQRFVREWLWVDPHREKDPERYPDYTQRIADLMLQELDARTAGFIGEHQGNLSRLFVSDETYLNAELGSFYGVDPSAGLDEQFRPFRFEGRERRVGVLSTGAVMASLALANEPNPMQRGRLIHEQLLCFVLPDHPPQVDVTLPPPDGERMQRERWTQDYNPACAACHVYMDPLGFAFSHFDAVGRYRETEDGLEIETRGTLALDGRCAAFSGYEELSVLLVDTQAVHDCFTRQLFRFYQRRIETDGDGCVIEQAREALQGSLDVRYAAAALLSEPALALRVAEK